MVGVAVYVLGLQASPVAYIASELDGSLYIQWSRGVSLYIGARR
jgi:hypothetical protein